VGWVLALDELRARGLVKDSSPLLGRLLADLPGTLEREVLPRLDAADRAAFALVALACRAGGSLRTSTTRPTG